MNGIRTTQTILDRIVVRKMEEVAALRAESRESEALDAAMSHLPRDFAGALRRADGRIALIAEIKRASPSRGVLLEHLDPADLAETYEAGGASALSVLTDRDFFKGSLADLQAARTAVELPVLRKDFTIDVRQVVEARAAGADAVLLIAAILDDGRLAELADAAWDYDLTAIVEVHTDEEMDRALNLAPLPAVIGINNRDLHTFRVDLNVTRRLARMVAPYREDVILVAESGIHTTDDVRAVAEAGVDAILVGESIVTSPDIQAQVWALSKILRRNGL